VSTFSRLAAGCSQNREIPTAVEGHPMSSISVSIESAYVTSY